MSDIFRTRFAPSPTGRLHLGHAYAAQAVFSFAAHHGGKALLRIEDIDHTRCKPEFTDGIYEDLRWLGHSWPAPARVQSQHYTNYAKVVANLLQRSLAYPCTLSRSEIKAGKAPCPNRELRFTKDDIREWSEYSLIPKMKSADFDSEALINLMSQAANRENPRLPLSIRLNLETCLHDVSDYSLIYTELTDPPVTESVNLQDARPALVSWANSTRPDPIIARRDIGCSYHIAVTHDDHIQDITHVVRGADFVEQTPLHVLIQALMGWRTPIYYHHPLITDPTGRKLSKTARDLTIESLRARGFSPEDVLSRAAQSL